MSVELGHLLVILAYYLKKHGGEVRYIQQYNRGQISPFLCVLSEQENPVHRKIITYRPGRKAGYPQR